MRLKLLLIGMLALGLAWFNYYFSFIGEEWYGVSIKHMLLALAVFLVLVAFILRKEEEEEETEQLIITPKKKRLITFGRVLFLAVMVLSAVFYFFTDQAMHIASGIPILNEITIFIAENILERTYLGLFVTFVIGSLFFIFIPFEVTYLYFIATLHPLVSLAVVIGASLLGLSMNYLLGLLFSKRVEHIAKFEKLQGLVERFGGILLLIFALTPLPFQILTFIMGGMQYSYKKFVVFVIIAVTIKYALLSFYGPEIIAFFMRG